MLNRSLSIISLVVVTASSHFLRTEYLDACHPADGRPRRGLGSYRCFIAAIPFASASLMRPISSRSSIGMRGVEPKGDVRARIGNAWCSRSVRRMREEFSMNSTQENRKEKHNEELLITLAVSLLVLPIGAVARKTGIRRRFRPGMNGWKRECDMSW